MSQAQEQSSQEISVEKAVSSIRSYGGVAVAYIMALDDLGGQADSNKINSRVAAELDEVDGEPVTGAGDIQSKLNYLRKTKLSDELGLVGYHRPGGRANNEPSQVFVEDDQLFESVVDELDEDYSVGRRVSLLEEESRELREENQSLREDKQALEQRVAELESELDSMENDFKDAVDHLLERIEKVEKDE